MVNIEGYKEKTTLRVVETTSRVAKEANEKIERDLIMFDHMFISDCVHMGDGRKKMPPIEDTEDFEDIAENDSNLSAIINEDASGLVKKVNFEAMFDEGLLEEETLHVKRQLKLIK